MKRILLLFSALMLSCIALWAHDVEIDGIYYYLDETNKTAEVTYRGNSVNQYSNEYAGSVTIPETITYNSEIYSVTSIGYEAFSGCSGLTSVTIGESVTYIGERAFYDCSGLTSVTIPDSVTSIGVEAFRDCSGLTKVNYLGTVDKWVEIDFKNGESNPTYYAEDLYINNELLTDVKITSADSIKYYAFGNCQSIKSVEIGNSVTSIGEAGFADCSGLTSVIIPNTVTSIGDYAFYGCSGLTEVTIPNSVTHIGPSAFYNTGIYNNNSNWDNGVLYIDNCLIKAKSDVVKGSYTIKKGTRIIGYFAFSDCSGLTSITIPNSVTSIGYNAFEGCSGLTKVNYLGTVDKWVEIDFAPFSNPTYNAKDLYINNELLTDVKITTADSIKNYAFYNCQSIKSVEIGNSVTSIGVGAFIGCSELTSVTIGNSVTSIGNEAFYDCSGLTSVTIGNSVTSIGQYAFSGCDKLRKVTAYPTTVPNVYDGYSFAHYNAALYVPCNVYDDYFFDDVFGKFKVIECIAAEEDGPTSITETLADANITVSGGTISAEADFSIYNTIGQDVTAFNGSLQPGIYLVSIENNIVKVMVH